MTRLFQRPRVQRRCVVVQAARGVGRLRGRQRGVVAMLLLLLLGGRLKIDMIYGRQCGRRDWDTLPLVRYCLLLCERTAGELICWDTE